MVFNDIKLAVSYAYPLQEERNKNNMVGVAAGGAANGTYNADISPAVNGLREKPFVQIVFLFNRMKQ